MPDALMWTLAQTDNPASGPTPDAPPASAPPPNAPGGPAPSSAPGAASNGDAGHANTTQPSDPNTPMPPNGGAGGGGLFGGGSTGLFLILILVVMVVFMFSGQRKEKRKRAEMLSRMKKGNRVQTIGGILGTIVEVRDDEVIVKVDENANTRLRFARSAIQSVFDEPGDKD